MFCADIPEVKYNIPIELIQYKTTYCYLISLQRVNLSLSLSFHTSIQNNQHYAPRKYRIPQIIIYIYMLSRSSIASNIAAITILVQQHIHCQILLQI